MNIPSELHSIFLSSNGANNNLDVGSVSSCDSFLSRQAVEYPATYSTHLAQRSGFVDSHNFGNPADHHDPSAHPSSMRPICNSSLPTNGLSWNRLTRAAPAEKSWNHKMVEKKRRKDMKTLFSRLRSLLPEENIRGKRAVSDQVLEAVKYVRYMQQKVEDLSKERDKMSANFDKNAKVYFESDRSRPQGSDGELPTVNFKIKSVNSCVKVSINAFKEQIVYSVILLVLEECGLEVVNAASSAIHNTVFHTIHTKVSDINSFNIDVLYEKIWDLLTANDIQPDLRTVADH